MSFLNLDFYYQYYYFSHSKWSEDNHISLPREWSRNKDGNRGRRWGVLNELLLVQWSNPIENHPGTWPSQCWCSSLVIQEHIGVISSALMYSHFENVSRLIAKSLSCHEILHDIKQWQPSSIKMYWFKTKKSDRLLHDTCLQDQRSMLKQEDREIGASLG